jgi:peptidoglycan/LPS O-acetylase OafA/YrhL
MVHARNRDLDGVRGLAILLVVAAHVGLPLRWGGMSGVTLFFVLSGYLITALLIREWDRFGSISLWRFWGRRALRLLPALFLLLALVPVLLLATHDRRLATYPEAAVASALYIGNWLRVHDGMDLGVLNHLWSLSVEEQFYVVWPLLFVAILTWFRRRALSIVFTLAALATCYSVWSLGSYITTETNAFALLLGVCLAFVLAEVQSRGWELPHSSPLVPFVVMVAVSAFPGHGTATDETLFRPLGVLYALVGVWLVATAALGHSRLVGSRVLVFFGTISYALYLWHQTLINSLLLGAHTVPRNAALVAAAVLVSWLSWVLVERPAGRLRGRLRLDREAQTPVDVATVERPLVSATTPVPAQLSTSDPVPADQRSSGGR